MKKTRLHVYVSERSACQMQIMAYSPSDLRADRNGVSELIESLWQKHMRDLRDAASQFTYHQPEEPPMKGSEKLTDFRSRILANEEISLEEYREAVSILREERGLVVTTTRKTKANPVKTKIVLPQDLNELFGKKGGGF